MVYSFPDVHSFSIHSLAAEEAFCKLDAEIAKTQAYLCSLQALRNSLPPIAHIPIELLSTIFAHCPDDEDKTRFSISWVCRRWRDTALAMPALWTDITVKNGENLALAKLLIERSRASNLSISLASPNGGVLKTCLLALPRVQHFRLDMSSDPIFLEFYEELLELFSRAAPLLSSLELIKFDFPQDRLLFSASCPQLRSLVLQSCRMRSLPQFITPTLTSLHIKKIKSRNIIPQLLDILPSFQNLESLSIEHLSLVSVPTGLISLPRLSCLSVRHADCLAVFDFLGHFDVPRARVSVLWTGDIEEESVSEFLPALENYLFDKGFPVRHLKIHYNEDDHDYTIDFSTDLSNNRHSIELYVLEVDLANDTTLLVHSITPMAELESFTTTHLPEATLQWLGRSTTLKSVTLEWNSELVLDFISAIIVRPKHLLPGRKPFVSLKKLVLRGLRVDPNIIKTLYTALELHRRAGAGLDQLEFYNCSSIDRTRFVPPVNENVNILVSNWRL
ncbi:hypothetical protein BDN72DRAFT_854678 [Pluteus cervinus]|uniref:Uncharacterized protein n=1 Tax=Pluteus cervinus TaxID=181527 RepID=A0ACD3B6Y4_9AGAR|nr:hypothetical protein BDN72DRAFT_854678 [Pluteus cervinus]